MFIQLSKKLRDAADVHISPEKMKQKMEEIDPKERKSLEDRFKSILTQPEQVVPQLNDQLDFLTSLSAAYNETTVISY